MKRRRRHQLPAPADSNLFGIDLHIISSHLFPVSEVLQGLKSLKRDINPGEGTEEPPLQQWRRFDPGCILASIQSRLINPSALKVAAV